MENARVESRWHQFLSRVEEGRETRVSPLPRHLNKALQQAYCIRLDLERCYGLQNSSTEIFDPDVSANPVVERPLDGSGTTPGLQIASN